MPFFSNFVPAIQPIGDSITQGINSATTAGWRETSYFAQGANGSKFRWVGLQTTNAFGLANINPNHEGHSGYVVRQGTATPSLIDISNTNIPLFGPDIALLYGGTNDLDPGVNNDSPATLATSLGTWLDAVAAKMLTGRSATNQIIVFTLLKRLDATDTKIQAYNAIIPGVIAGKSYSARIKLVDIYNTIVNQSIGQGYSDAVHPTTQGHTDMGNAIYANANFQAALLAARPTF